MLESIRRAAQTSGLPQTMFASRWHGKDCQSVDCVLTSAAAALLAGAAGSAPSRDVVHRPGGGVGGIERILVW